MADEQAIVASEKPKVGLIEFLRETRREVTKVTWPNRKEIFLTTIMVVVFALIFGIFFLIVDSILGYVVTRILGMN